MTLAVAGTVSVTNGSAVVTGTGTGFVTAGVPVGAFLQLAGAVVSYEVASIDSETQVTLSAPYQGASASGRAYQLAWDFSTNEAFPLPQPGEVNPHQTVRRFAEMVDSRLGPAVAAVLGLAAEIAAVAAIDDDVTAVAGAAANIAIVAGDSADIQALGPVAAAIAAVAAIDDDVTAVAALSTAVAAVAALADDVTAVAAIDTDVTAVAGINATHLAAVAAVASAVSAVAAIDTDVTAVAGINATHLAAVAAVASAVSAVAALADDVSAVAADATNIGIVAAAEADIATVADNIATIAEKLSRDGTLAMTGNLDMGGNDVVAAGRVGTAATGMLYLPAGTAAQRPGSPAFRGLRYNTDEGGFEGWDGSAWGAVGGAGGGGGFFAGELVRVSATSLHLVGLTGGLHSVPDGAGGWVHLDISTAPTISNSGLSSNTLYWCYLRAVGLVPTLELSTALPATSFGAQVKTGATDRLLVGVVYTNSAGEFDDTETARRVRSWYNRRALSLTNSFTAQRTTTSTAWIEVNSEIRCNFIALPGDAFMCATSGYMYNGGAFYLYCAAGLDGAATVVPPHGGMGYGLNGNTAASAGSFSGLATGHHFLTYLGRAQGDTAYYGSATTFNNLSMIISPGGM